MKKNPRAFLKSPKSEVIPPDESSIHGLRFILGKNRHPFTRLFWFTIFVVAAASFSYCGYKITNRMFFRVDLVTNIKQVSTREIPFPAVSVCQPVFTSDKAANISKILEDPKLNISSEDCKPFVVNTQKCPSKVSEIISSKCSDSFEGESITKMIENSSLELSKVLVGCSWREQSIDCKKIFNPIVSDNGICYSFNMQGFGSIFNRGIISDEFKAYKR